MSFAAAFACALIGAIVAAAEILGRYRAYPGVALASAPGASYLALNAIASATAYALSEAFDWRFGLPPNAPSDTLTLIRVVVAGFGAIALLRSSLFVFAQGDTQIDAGPSGVLAGLRTWVDRSVDQHHAQTLIRGDLLAGLSFMRDHEGLTLLCSTALVNPDAESAERLGTLAAELKASTELSDEIKLQVYAMKLLELAGRRPLEAAAARLRAAHPVDSHEADASSEPSGAVPASRTLVDAESALRARQDAWDHAQSVSAVAKSQHTGALRIDLQLLRASLLDEVDRMLGAIAFAEVDLAPAKLLFGAPTLLSTSHDHVSHRLLQLLQLRTVESAATGRRLRATPREPVAAWVIAAALFELWPLLSDPVLATAALTASIACRDFWDARAARAALWLQVGEEAKAAEDLDRALSGNDRNRNLEPDENEPMVVAVDAFEPVLRPIRGLLEPTLSSFARIALWNAAVESWNSRTGDRPKRLTSKPADFRILRTYLEQHSEEEAITTSLSQLLMALAKSLPPRVPFGGLRESDFYRKPDEVPLDPEVVTSLRTAIGDAPQNKDESISGLPSLESVLGGSLESWLSRRGSDLQSLDLRPPPAAGRQGRRISVEDSV